MERQYKDSGIEWIGKIPEDWEVSRLKYFSVFINGFAFNSDSFTFNYGCKVIRIGDISDTINYLGCIKANVDTASLQPYRILENDILIAMSGATTGKCCIVKNVEEAYINQRVGIIRSNDFSYIYYSLQTDYFMEYIHLNNAGSAQPNISGTSISNFPLLLPPLSKQQRIADYLDKKCGEIDSLIGLQEQMIEKLKAYKQSVITEAVTKGLNPNAKLVPSGIDWIGEIPEGWKIVPLKWILRNPLQYGANESGLLFDESLPRYVRITDISNNNLREDLQKQSLSEEQANGYILEDNDILFARSGGTVGKAFIYKLEYGRCAFAGYLIRAQINSQNEPKFIYYYTQSSSYDEWKKQIFIQATIQNIGADRYSILDIPLPPLSEQRAISSYLDEKCSDIDRLIAIKQQKIEKLKDYKKSVIYEAVTGKTEIQ